MYNVITDWFKKYFSHPEAIILLMTIVIIILIFETMGKMLAPVFASIVIAYLLDGIVRLLERWKCPHLLAVSLVVSLFVGLLLLGIIWLMPMLWGQLTNLFNELPSMVNSGQAALIHLPERYPSIISTTQVQGFMATLKSELAGFGKIVLAHFVGYIPNAIEIAVYAVLVPLLVFFFLNDRDQIIAWLARFIPKKRHVIGRVWGEVNHQIGNYVRGRIIEMILVGTVSAVIFKLMDLNYAVLLGVLVGVAALIPYIGAVVVTIPIVIIALLQWGWSTHFAYLIIVYTVISLIDSNIIVPLLFSGTMNLHPVAIIVAIIIFGGFWGFWGVFFAIPLATVVKAVITEWPTTKLSDET